MTAVTIENTNGIGEQAKTVLVAGAFATLAFDIFGQALAPALGFAQLAPVGLANQVIKTLTGAGWRPGAEMLHYIAGLIAYPLGWFLIAEPFRARFTPWMHWSLAATAYGIFLWVFALYGMAHLIAGMKPFLGFTGITWVALWGHVLFALVVATIGRLRS